MPRVATGVQCPRRAFEKRMPGSPYPGTGGGSRFYLSTCFDWTQRLVGIIVSEGGIITLENSMIAFSGVVFRKKSDRDRSKPSLENIGRPISDRLQFSP